MKQAIIFSFFLVWGVQLFAQAPHLINYQVVARDNNGNPLPGIINKITFKIHEGSATGSVIFQEEHNNQQTDNCAMLNLKIGSQNPATFSTVDWSTGTKYLEVEIISPSGQVSGTSQMLSVPYALYAETSGNGGITYSAGQGVTITGDVISAADVSPTNEIQTLSLSGNQLLLSNGGGSVTLTGGTDSQTLSVSGNQISISNGNAVTLPQDGDGSSTNEFQSLSLSGSQLTLSNGGGTVNLPPDTDAQTLSISGNQLTIIGGNSVAIPANTYQAGNGISISGSTITNISLSPVIEVNSTNMNTVVAPDGSIVAIYGTITLASTYQKLENSAVIMGGVVNGNGNLMYLENNAVVNGTVFNSVGIDGLSASFKGCTFNGVTELPSKASFVGCQFNNCNISGNNYSDGFMNNCTVVSSTIPKMDRVTNSLISNSTLGSTSSFVKNASNSEFNDSFVYLNGTFTGNDCDNSQVLARNSAGHVTISGNNFEIGSNGLSTDIINVDMNTGSRNAVNISNNNFLGNTTMPSGQYIRLYGSYTGTRCIAKISNNIFIGGSAKAVSYECTGQVDLVVNDNDMRATSGGWGVSDGGFIEFRNNFSY